MHRNACGPQKISDFPTGPDAHDVYGPSASIKKLGQSKEMKRNPANLKVGDNQCDSPAPYQRPLLHRMVETELGWM